MGIFSSIHELKFNLNKSVINSRRGWVGQVLHRTNQEINVPRLGLRQNRASNQAHPSMSSHELNGLGNWDDDDDDDDDAQLEPYAKKAVDYESLGDVFEFTDDPLIASKSNACKEDENLPKLPPGAEDLTGDRGVILEIENAGSSSAGNGSLSSAKPSKEQPFVQFHYEGFLADSGEKFDSSRDQNYPMVVQLDIPPVGKSSLIQGLELGLRHLSAGQVAKLSASAAYAYGEKGAPDIPPNSDLVFQIEVLDVRATHRHVEVEDFTATDLSRLEDVRKQREVAQQRREEEARARDEEKQRKAERAAALQEKLAKKKQVKKKGKKK